MNRSTNYQGRALTLVEVLISLVLLTLIATTTLPLIQRATAVLAEATAQEGHRRRSFTEFSLAVDAILAAAPPELSALQGDGLATLTWQAGSGDRFIAARALAAGSADSNHEWVEFSSDCGWKAYRWRAVEPKREQAGEHPSGSGGAP